MSGCHDNWIWYWACWTPSLLYKPSLSYKPSLLCNLVFACTSCTFVGMSNIYLVTRLVANERRLLSPTETDQRFGTRASPSTLTLIGFYLTLNRAYVIHFIHVLDKEKNISSCNNWKLLVVTIFPGDMGGGGSVGWVTNGDKGGGGSKIDHFRGDVIFEWPLNVSLGAKKLIHL